MTRLFLTLLFFYILASTAHAKELFLIIANDSVTASEAIKAAKDAKKFLYKKKIPLTLRGIGFITTPPASRLLNQAKPLFYAANAIAKQKYKICNGVNKNVYCHILDTPLEENNLLYVAGLSETCETNERYAKRAASWSTFVHVSKSGLPRRTHSLIAMIHEILHAFGAYHKDVIANVMHPNALIFVDQYKLSLPLLTHTKKEIYNCDKK